MALDNPRDIKKYALKLSAREYYDSTVDGRFLTSSLLGYFQKSPRLYRHYMNECIDFTDFDRLAYDRALHTLVLEGRASFDDKFNIVANDSLFASRTPASKKEKIGQYCFDRMTRIQQSVWSNPNLAEILEQGESRQVIRGNLCGEPCQACIDWYNPDYKGNPALCAFKVCNDIEIFEKELRKSGSMTQMAFQHDILIIASSGNIGPECYIIVCETQEPFRSCAWHLSDNLLDFHSNRISNVIKRLQRCRRDNAWPRGYEGIKELDVMTPF